MKKIILIFTVLFLVVGFVGAFDNKDEAFEDFRNTELYQNEAEKWYYSPYVIVQDLETVDAFFVDLEAWDQQGRMTVIRYKYKDGKWVETTSEMAYMVHPVKNSDGEKVWRDDRYPFDKAVKTVWTNGRKVKTGRTGMVVAEDFYTYYVEEGNGKKTKVYYVFAGEPLDKHLLYYRFDNPDEWGMTPHNPKD
jgi:hypothetical protein